ncbi:MAG: MBL fold metallo-hydrolase [Myxococcota bacterium]
MRAKIHRGAHEIGGSCVEVEAQGERLVLDIGKPITAGPDEDVPLPAVPGLAQGGDPSLRGVILSHPHPDHFGLLPQVAESVPVYMGQAACRILGEAAFFSPGGLECTPAGLLGHREAFELGTFRVTPFLNDHSAFDAYSLMIEADGRRLFYTGDIRAHGRKARVFEEFIQAPPGDIDVLLMEGTNIRADSTAGQGGPSEQDVERACVETFRGTQGIVLAMFSPQNVDRLVTIYRATLQSDRDLVVDLYTAAVAAATGRATIPQAHWDRVRVYLPRSQKARVMQSGAFDRTDAVRPARIYPEELRERRRELVLLFRGSMAREIEKIGCLEGAHALWSMWPGYLRKQSGQQLQAWLDRLAIPLHHHHSSGHAYLPDLRRLVDALAPERVVPIHSFEGDRFSEFFPRVDRRADGEWWEV